VKASEQPFLKFLQGTNQFVVPIYQRRYSWTTDECSQLWDDIVRIVKGNYPGGHFVGSIVYIESGLFQVGPVPKLLIIDGQQRLTTLSLLIAAFARELKRTNPESDISERKLVNYYLVNPEEEGDEHRKLILTRGDRETLDALLDARPLPDLTARRLRNNFEFFVEKIRHSEIPPDDFYDRGLQKLMIVNISLDRTHDNPQLIFESLNSTGLELTQADLIRNFVLMALEPGQQEELYNNYWYPMEQSFGTDAYAAYFDRFVRDFLTLKTGRIPNIDKIYVAFKEYARESKKSVGELVAELHRYSRHFVSMALEREPDGKLNAAIADINTLRVDVAYPFLLHAYDLYDRGALVRDDLHKILRVVESYVYRRVICGIPTNTLNRTFASLAAQMHASNPVESIEAAFLMKDSYRRLPRDDEFTREFVAKDVYNLRSRNYLLRKLENHGRKEYVDVETYTIEHIMPQNPDLSKEWRSDLGPNWEQVQARYLHTIGNLTLTGYNSELSDRPFKVKRDMEGGFADSPIRLNRDLAKLDMWNEHHIERRARQLAKLAVEIWGIPRLSDAVIDLYRPEAAAAERGRSIEDHPHLRGVNLRLFEDIRQRILNIDSSVSEEVLKLYIAYKSASNFVDVIPQRSGLKLSLAISLEELHDPKARARDVSAIGHWGNGDVEVKVGSSQDLDYAMGLIRQAFDRQSEAADA
jgi:uncharacterized protein with ParB-like and HNH nuclease domain/predicted transport protein